MYFKRIDMHGFKSFADPVSIEFHEGITCIVGPNGSGKSNISDAIRWVLGEQSPKMLRGGKMEEVIFAGTASRKSRGMAEVTLVIDNSKGILPIDYAEVAITRRMYRSGESEYSINNNHCRLRDIRELIMDTGIGVDGYSLIGQGKIADIVSNKPESRREIFEEAAGIVKYRTKKMESERKLEASAGNLERVNDIISEIESRIGKLKNDSEKAKEYLILRDRYKELEINVTLKNIENIELKNEYIKDDLAELASQIEEMKEDKASIDTELTEYRNRNEELGRLGNETRDKLLISVEKINELVNQNQLNREKLATIDKDIDRLKDEISVIDSKLEKEAESETTLQADKDKLYEELSILKNDLDQRLMKQAELSAAINTDAAAIDQQKNRIYELHSSISSKNSEINSLLSLQGTLEKRREQVLADRESAEAMRNGLAERHLRAVQELAVRKDEFQKATEQRHDHIRSHNERILREKSLAKELEELRISIGQISTRKKMIEEMESSYEGYNNAVKFIMKSKLSGINGVVAELIEVPQGFETAIETALGAALQNIVCEDDHSAQAAIGALKANKAGRLTFLPIKSMRDSSPSYDQRLKNSEGFKGFGVQCIKFDEKYRKVMEYLLGRVIIVDTLDHAVRLSKNAGGGGLRFVTLEGEVINSGGAITGGTFRNNTANLLERKAEIKQLGEKLNSMELSKNRGSNELDELRAAIASGQDTLQRLDLEHREKELELLSKENSAAAMSGQLSELELAEEKSRRELNNIDSEKSASESMINEIRTTVQQASEDIVEIEKITDTGLQNFELKKSSLDEVNEEITRAKIAVGTAESRKNHVDQLLSRIEDYKKEIKEERYSKEETILTLEAEKSSLLEGDNGLESGIRAREQEKLDMERYLREIQEEKASVTKHLDEITKKKDEMDQILAGYQNQKYDLEIKQAKYDTQLDTYKDKLWEEFEVSYLQAIEFRKKDFNLAAAVKETREIKSRIKDLGEVNVGAIKEFESVSERYDFLSEQRSDILGAMNSLKQIIDDMDKTIKQSFKESFDKIVLNFEKAFQELFGGGAAELRLEDENNPLECGIEIVAQPPGKKLQNINLMSGGEKTMTAIALMFAVLRAKPTPFCILDEVEAALDDANIDRFASYLKNFDEIQFALVTHQKATMEYADVLYGVTMPEQGISRIISLRLGDEFLIG
ncbi:chromosome segregation protein SMC [Anoxybacterium hadale]|uniref:Chromosome segregation protein SMC n=1 Tax=Anoxybacterium hadale TaxID=3408580 RepID=A0ACD1AAH2_9FIRM|nr:chromosome segregation protein SMC [Clostridiales bacterium]